MDGCAGCDFALAYYNRNTSAPVAQLDRVTASEAVGCAFEPRRAHLRKLQIPSSKHQKEFIQRRRPWSLGVWSFSGAWSLGFGASVLALGEGLEPAEQILFARH